MVLNMGEGSRRQGGDRVQRYRIAAGSAAETRDALEVARGWGYVDSKETATPLAMLDKVLGLLWGLTHKGA
jgi:four helix bundle protein